MVGKFGARTEPERRTPEPNAKFGSGSGQGPDGSGRSGSAFRAGIAVPNRFEPINARVHRNTGPGDLPALLSARMTIPTVYIRHRVVASIAKRCRTLSAMVGGPWAMPCPVFSVKSIFYFTKLVDISI